MSKKDDEGYTVIRLHQDVPDLAQYELEDLIFEYTTYQIKNFRLAYVEGINKGLDNYQITEDVIAAKDQKFDEIRKTPKEGGEQSKTGKKLKRAAIRVLLLRYKAQGFKNAQARAYVRNKHFPELSLRAIQDHTQDKSKKLPTSE